MATEDRSWQTNGHFGKRPSTPWNGRSRPDSSRRCVVRGSRTSPRWRCASAVKSLATPSEPCAELCISGTCRRVATSSGFRSRWRRSSADYATSASALTNSRRRSMASALSPTDLADRIRRDIGRSVLRAKNGIKFMTGIGRPDVGASPKDTVWTRDKLQLWRYQSEQRRYRPPLLLIMSLVSRSYIFDLRPGSSMVEDFLAAGLDVFL